MPKRPGWSRVLQLCQAAFWALPLLSLAPVAGAARSYVFLVVAIFAAALWRPVAGLVGLGLIAPLAFAVSRLTGAPLMLSSVAEGLVLAMLAGTALHAAVRPAGIAPLRLRWPVVSLGLVVATAWAYWALVQFGSVGSAVVETLRHLTESQLVVGRASVPQASMRWLEVVALALVVERALRTAPQAAPFVLATWLGAGAATAAQSLVRIAQVALSRGEGLGGWFDVAWTTRITGVYPDVNAAGSLFAMLAVSAVVFGIARRRWLFTATVGAVLVAALAVTQSRAAVIAALLVLAAIGIHRLAHRRWRAAAGVIAVAAVAAAATLALVDTDTHVSAEAALSSRVEMWRIALQVTQDRPVFGVGPGQFQAASLPFITPAFVETFPAAAVGENAHNNFLQVLAELGVVGLLAFVWMLGAALAPRDRSGGRERFAILAGLAAFLVSALFGHPLLIFQIAVAFFFALGLAAGLAPPMDVQRSRWRFAIIAFVLVTLPWRVAGALAPSLPRVTGATDELSLLDGLSYRTAEQVSRWRVRPGTESVLFPLRWKAGGSSDCLVTVSIDGRTLDQVTVPSGIWEPTRVAIPSDLRDRNPLYVELNVSSDACRLLVGPLTSWP